jgi:hypothetical protein
MKKYFFLICSCILFVTSCSSDKEILDFENTKVFKAKGGNYSDAFARHVAISGKTAVVSAQNDQTILKHGIAGGNGAIYIFEKQGTTWKQTHKLTPADIDKSSEIVRFGVLVDIDGDIIVVQASEKYKDREYQTTHSERTVNYVIERSGETWVKTAKLTIPSTAFGAVCNRTILIGYAYATPDEEVINGTQKHRSKGAVYVYNKKGGEWVVTAKLAPQDSKWNDNFGYNLASDGRTLVVSRPERLFEDSDPGISIFANKAGQWKEVSNFNIEHCHVSTALAVCKDTIVVSSPIKKENENWVHIFKQIGQEWQLVKTLTPPDKAASRFGISVATNGNYVAVQSGFSRKASALYLYKGPDWKLVEDYKWNTFWAGEKIGPLRIDGDTLIVGIPSDPVYPDNLLFKLINLFYKDAFYQEGGVCFFDLHTQ